MCAMFALLLLLLLLVDSCSKKTKVVVVGAGAAGYFSSITCGRRLAQAKVDYEIMILEQSSTTLNKVQISGGGRCNVCHNPLKGIPAIIKGYSRGSKELLSPFNKDFGPMQTVDWFNKENVKLKVEEDDRVFPVTDSSQTIINALESAAAKAKVLVQCNSKVTAIHNDQQQLIVEYMNEDNSKNISCDKIIIATGSFRQSYNLLTRLGHTLIDPVPSLFSFKINDANLTSLSGVSHPYVGVRLVIPKDYAKGEHKHLLRGDNVVNSLSQIGPMLVTHQGLSGPAILKLSSYGARILHSLNYKFSIEINFFPTLSKEQIYDHLMEVRSTNPLRSVMRFFPSLPDAVLGGDMGVTSRSYESIPGLEIAKAKGTPAAIEEENNGSIHTLSKRLWQYLLTRVSHTKNIKVDSQTTWKQLTPSAVEAIANELTGGLYACDGRGQYRDEFVTAGGIPLKEVQFTSMQSKVIENVHIAGELLDIDAITGGYNFQSCWSTGYIAGVAVADELIKKKSGKEAV